MKRMILLFLFPVLAFAQRPAIWSPTVSSSHSAATVAITDDTTTNATMYPTWVTTTSGNLPLFVSSTKLTFNPNTGIVGLPDGGGITGLGSLSFIAGGSNKNVILTPSGTGIVTVPTAASGSNTTQAASTAFVETRSLLGTRSRQTRDAFLGVGSGAVTYSSPGSAAAVAGSPLSMLVPEWSVPSSNPTAIVYLWSIGSESSPSTLANTYALSLQTDGSLRLQMSTDTSNYNRLSYAGFRAAYSGQPISIAVTSAGNTATAPTIFVNGVDISASFTPTNLGTVPNWMPSTLSTSYIIFGASVTGSYMFSGPINAALTAAEVLAWAQTGLLPTWCQGRAGTMVPCYTSNFVAGLDNWGDGAGSATLAYNQTAPDTSTGWVSYSSGNGAAVIQDTAVTNHGTSPGLRIKVQLTYYIPSSVSGVSYVGVGITGSNLTAQNTDQKFVIPVVFNTATTITGYVTLGANAGGVQFRACNSSTGGTAIVPIGLTFYIKNVTYTPVGPIITPIVQPIAVCADAGTNRLAGIVTGLVPVTSKRDWVIQATTTTNGNQQLLGAAVFFNTNNQRIDSWTINNAGSSQTTSLGNASAGTQYLSSGTTAGGLTDITLATRFNATTALWCNTNGTASLQHTITGHRID